VTGSHGTMPAPGPIGHNLIAALRELLKARGLSFNRASAAMGELGRPMPPLAFSRLMKGERRVDVDELVALAEVLGVTPAELLAPRDAKATPGADHPAIRATRDLAARIGQLLDTSADQAGREAQRGYVDRALRRLAIEVEELLAETRGQHAD
jgi:transcriptional regulator with XRE-family HTH domain